jgi:NADP-dependent aldehyde dehydrogenase
MTTQPIWIAGDWSPSSEAATFHATNPNSGEASEDIFPISTWADCDHAGPYPSTGHPGFTAVGIPASMLRFAALHCYDNVRDARLPPSLRDRAPNESIWRSVDGAWMQGDVR